MADAKYQMYLYVGSTPPRPPRGATLVDLTPAAATPEAVLSALETSGLTAADMRTRILMVVDPAFASEAVLVYSALIGFAGRRLDFTDMTAVVDARSLHTQATGAPDTGKPEVLPELVQIGHLSEGVASFGSMSALSSDDVTTIRFARRAHLCIGERNSKEALELLLIAAGLRVRQSSDRLPVLCGPLETLTVDEEGNFSGLDLDALRRAAGEARRTNRVDVRDAIVDAVPLTARQERLNAAAAVPVEDVLLKIGSFQDPETGFWRCPRPDRHRNGDANPSTRVTDGHVRCFRCDAEPRDSLALVMDCLHVTPDEAADWLLV